MIAKPLTVIPPNPVCINCGEPITVDNTIDQWVHADDGLIVCDLVARALS